MEKMRNLFLRSQCFNKIFSTKSKKKVQIIYTSFLNIWSQLLQKCKKFLEEMQNLFLRLAFKLYFAELVFEIYSSKLYFEDQIFAISGQNHKNKFRNNLFHDNLWSQKFLPSR